MSDTTPGGFADTPGPDATAEQDADVRALLALLRDEPLEMPPQVAARLDAVLAEERRTAAATRGTASALRDAEGSATGHLAPVTVLPVVERRGPSTRTFRIVGGLAAAALVVVGGIAVLGQLGSGSSASTSAGDAAMPEAASSGSAGTRLTASGATYTAATLAVQARTLAAVSLGRSVTTQDSAGSPAAPGGTASPGTEYSADVASAPTSRAALSAAAVTPESVRSCVASLTDGDGTVAVAVDAGTFAGKPALVVVLPTKDDPTSLDVLVVTRDCSPSFLTFARIARP